MPNITISGLPPAILPLDDPNTLFEVTVLEAGEEVSRKITLSDIASSTGLDASFLTLSANAQLPNERVLTEGTNVTFVDTGPNGTLTINAGGVSFPLLAPDGTDAAPSYSWASAPSTGIHLIATNLMGFSILGTTNWEMGGLFQAANNAGPAISNTAVSGTVPGLLPAQQDPNTGIGSNTLDQLSLIAGGAEIARATAAFNANQFAIIQSGSTSVPELTSLADPDTGFRWTGANQLTFIGSGSRAWHFTSARFFSEFSQGPALLNVTAQNDVPTVLADQSDSDTGIGSSGNDELSIIAGGVEGIRVEETAGNVFITYFGPILVPFGSGTQPGYAFDGDDDTGIFRPVDDALGITAGGVESVRFAELSSQIIQTNSNQVGLTASVTQTQAGGLALLSSYNEITTVATTGDALTAFAVVAGTRLIVINNGANDLQLFPAVGDDFGAGVDAAITIAAGELGIFIGRDATNWDTLKNAPATGGGDVIKVGTPVDNQVGVWTGDGTIEGTANFTYDTGTKTFGLGAGSTFFTESSLYSFQDGNLTLDGEGTIFPILSIIQGGINNQSLAISPTAMTFGHDAGGLVFNISGNLARWEFETTLRVTNATGLDWIEQDHDGTDYNFAAVNTADINFTGISGRIMQDAETLAFLSEIPTGTVTDSTLRFDGSDYVEETQVRISAAGILTVLDATLADSFAVAHNGSDVLLTSVGAAKVRFGGTAGTDVTNEVGNFEARSGNALIAFDSGNADLIRISHNGTDTLMANTGSASVLHTGATIGYKYDNSIYITEQAAANADTAGEGQFWTRDDVPNIPMFTNDVGVDFKLGVANDAVQARRTTSYVLTTAFADVTLDTTDIETDGAIIEHSGTTDRIEATVAGTYEFTYGADIDPGAAGNDNIQAFGRMRLNDLGVDIPGSLASQSAFEDASTIGNQVFGRLQCSFIIVLAASDFVTLQLLKVETGGTGVFTAEEVTVTAKRLL